MNDDDSYHDATEEMLRAETTDSLSSPQGSYVMSTEHSAQLIARRPVETLSVDDVIQRMLDDAEEFRTLACVSPELALAILKVFQWSLAAAKERYYDRESSILNKLAITDSSEQPELDLIVPDNAPECFVCGDELERGARDCAVSIRRCGHWAHRSCLAESLLYSIDHHELIPLRCRFFKCPCLASNELPKLLLEGDALSKYRSALVREYLQGNTTMKWCANPRGCGFVIAVGSNREGFHQVKCDRCSTMFCFNCSEDSHGPATCSMLQKWNQKSQDDSESANWVMANTKTCPNSKCRKATEKNGGCNHMTCSQCRHEWCWVCEGDWSKHGSSYYQCNFYNPSNDKGKGQRDAARESLQRYSFYFSRYANHKKSAQLDAEVMAKVQSRLLSAMTENSSDPAAFCSRYLEETALVLSACRHTLQYTYIYSYYLEEGQAKKLFEYQQAQLEHSTEELSHVIEGTKVMDRQEVVNKTGVAKKFHQQMQEGCWTDK